MFWETNARSDAEDMEDEVRANNKEVPTSGPMGWDADGMEWDPIACVW